MYYKEKELTGEQVIGGEKCYGYNKYSSHEKIVYGARGEYDKIPDPRPGHGEDNLHPERFYINDGLTEVKGINYYDKNGNFACSYTGESYAEISQKARFDLDEKRAKQYENTNIKPGVKRDRIQTDFRSFDRTTRYDTTQMQRDLPLDSRDVQLKSQEKNPEIYDKYQGVTNPVNGHPLTCQAVYTNKPSGTKQEETQYVELLDKQTGEKFHYISSYAKNVDQKIGEDMQRQNQTQRQTQNQTSTMQQQRNNEQGVNRR